MDQVGEEAAKFARGSFFLFIGNVISYLALAVGSIFVARLLSPSEYGLYGVALILPETFNLFSNWGINAALTRFIAGYRSENELEKIQQITRTAFIFKISVGSILSISLYLFADVLSSVILKKPELGTFVKTASWLILFRSIFSTIISALAGLERMDLRAFVNVIAAIVKGISSPLLVYLGFGVYGPIIGFVSSYIIASIIGIILLMLNLPNPRNTKFTLENSWNSLGLMLGYSIPLFLGNLIIGLTGRFQSFFLNWFVSDVTYGNYHVALNFANLIGLVTGTLGVSLLPAFSKINFISEPLKTRKAFQWSIRYSSMFVIPLVGLLTAVSKPMIEFLYTNRYPQAPFLVVLFLIPNLLIGVGAITISNFLNSQNDTRINFIVELKRSFVSILVSPLLIWKWGVVGLALSIIITRITRNVLGLYIVNNRYGFLPEFRHSLRTLLCSIVSSVITYGVVKFLSDLTPFILLFVGSFSFLLSYLVLAPLLDAIDENDIRNIDSMLKNLVLIYPFSRIFLMIEMRILGYKQRRNLN